MHPADDAERVRRGSRRKIVDPGERRRMGEAGRRTALITTPGRGCRELGDYYDDLLRRATSMERDVLVRFVFAAAVWLTVAACSGRRSGGGPARVRCCGRGARRWRSRVGDVHAERAPFGKVVGIGTTPQPMVAITFDVMALKPGVDAGRARRAPLFWRAGDVLRALLGSSGAGASRIARRIVDEGHAAASHGDDRICRSSSPGGAIVHQFFGAAEKRALRRGRRQGDELLGAA